MGHCLPSLRPVTHNVLVTGATGFLGSCLVRKALNAGARVATLCRTDAASFLERETCVIRGTLERPDWGAIEAFRPDVCVHCAWIATPGEYIHSPLNTRLAEATMDFARRLEILGLRHFVGIGSCAEYEPSFRALKENDPEARNATPYVKSKLEVLRFLESTCATPFSWLRIFYLYGAGEHPGRFLTSAAKTLKAGRELIIQRPEDLVDYVHVDDAADAAWDVVRGGQTGVYNVGSGESRTVSSIAVRLGELTGHPELVRCADQKTSTGRVADIEKLKATGWKPRRDFVRSLGEIVATA